MLRFDDATQPPNSRDFSNFSSVQDSDFGQFILRFLGDLFSDFPSVYSPISSTIVTVKAVTVVTVKAVTVVTVLPEKRLPRCYHSRCVPVVARCACRT